MTEGIPVKYRFNDTKDGPFKSQNMNYVYYYEYFEGLEAIEDSEKNDDKHRKPSNEPSEALKRTNKLCDFKFASYDFTKDLKGVEGYKDFSLYTQYPGLLIGIGNEHNLALDGGVKCGFTFDYVTGLPYISGSSLKGMLRSCFGKKNTPNRNEHHNYIRALLRKEQLDVEKLEQDIFENNDIFIGAYPVINAKQILLDKEYVTPTTADFYTKYYDRPAHSIGELQKFKNPVPINFIKVKPDIRFKFSFILHDSVIDKDVITAEEKLNLFQVLILENGMGAKTNTGFSRFSSSPSKFQNRTDREPVETVNKKKDFSKDLYKGKKQGGKKESYTTQDDDIPPCITPGCTNKAKFNVNIGKFGNYCEDCLERIRAERNAMMLTKGKKG